jgi:hypothetical protein
VYIITVYFVYMFGVMLISLYALCLFVLWRVEELVTEDPGEQQVEVAEQELRQVVPLITSFYPAMF